MRERAHLQLSQFSALRCRLTPNDEGHNDNNNRSDRMGIVTYIALAEGALPFAWPLESIGEGNAHKAQ